MYFVCTNSNLCQNLLMRKYMRKALHTHSETATAFNKFDAVATLQRGDNCSFTNHIRQTENASFVLTQCSKLNTNEYNTPIMNSWMWKTVALRPCMEVIKILPYKKVSVCYNSHTTFKLSTHYKAHLPCRTKKQKITPLPTFFNLKEGSTFVQRCL